MTKETKKKKQTEQTLKEYLSKENVEKVKGNIKEKVKEEALKETMLTEEQAKAWEEIVKEAKMPVELKDDDFVLGENELDIRSLNDKNTLQMLFRTQVLNNVYLRQVAQSQVDIMRLIMILLKKSLNIKEDEIIKEIDTLITNLSKTVKN